jgi:hypothetical protein
MVRNRSVRRPGGGRKSAAQLDPALVPALLALVEPDERGDPMSPLRWTTKSLRHLLERAGHAPEPTATRYSTAASLLDALTLPMPPKSPC